MQKMQKKQVQSRVELSRLNWKIPWRRGWKDPLEKAMATLSSILAWEISWTEEPGGLQSMGSQKSNTA